MEREATVKTASESNAALKPSQEVETLNEVEAVALVYTQDDTFLQVQAYSVTDILIRYYI